MFDKLRKWNWGAFFAVMLLCTIGACGNKNVKTFVDIGILIGIFGVPFGLLWAWLGRDE